MREIEWKLLSELMKNSRRSDRDLAKAMGSSQPTVTRARTKLEKEGYIREYTMTPDFGKLGYEIMALTFVNSELGFTREEIEKTREAIREKIRETPSDLIMVERGKRMKFDGVVISLHKTYECFNKLRDRFRQYSFMQPDIDSFLMSARRKSLSTLNPKNISRSLFKNNQKRKEEIGLQKNQNSTHFLFVLRLTF